MNTLSPQQIAFLAGIGLFLLIALPLSYYSLAKAYGRTLAMRLMPRTVAIDLLIALVLVSLVVSTSGDADVFLSILWGGLTIWSWSRVIAARIKRSPETRILLDLGTPFRTSSGIIAFLSMVGVGLLLVALVVQHLYFLFGGLCLLAQAAWFSLQNQEHMIITEKGLQVAPNTIHWDHIKGYQWANDMNGTALLVIQSRRRLELFPTMVIRIPAIFKTETSTLLAEHVPMS